MSYRIEKIDQSLGYGAIIHGLTESDLRNSTVQSELRNLWVERGLIIVKGEITQSFQVAFGKVFGELESHPVKEAWVDGQPELMRIRYRPGEEAVYEVGGEELGGWQPWHSDMMYLERVNRGGVLRAVTLAKHGGRTGFIDQIAAYDSLPKIIKSRIDDLRIVYKLHADYSKYRYASSKSVRLLKTSRFVEDLGSREENDFPAVSHPVVFWQPETGRKVLNVCPMFAKYIEGMDNPEGHDLLHTLVNHIANEDIAYYHRWEASEMLLWDNWRMLHCATGVAPSESREMHRVILKGDYGLGRKL